jgi:hypothetical protein
MSEKYLVPYWWIKSVEKKLEGTGYELIVFISYDYALMWHIFEKLFALLAVMLVAIVATYTISIPLAYLIELVGMVIMLKLWRDMIFKSRPFENCWRKPG